MKKHIRHEQYKEDLFEKQTFQHGMDVLRSEQHHIYGQRLNKVSLSPFSKRWIAENGVVHTGLWAQRCNPCKLSAAAECQGAQEKVPRGRIPAEAHPASSTTQARQAWSPSAQAGESSKTILDQSHGDDRLPAGRVGTDCERQHLKGAFAREGQLDGLEQWRRVFVSQIVP